MNTKDKVTTWLFIAMAIAVGLFYMEIRQAKKQISHDFNQEYGVEGFTSWGNDFGYGGKSGDFRIAVNWLHPDGRRFICDYFCMTKVVVKHNGIVK